MKAVRKITGTMVPLPLSDVDTDQIMPKQFLKRVERTGFGEFVFYEWRQEPGFVLNDPAYEGANVLIAGPNFGSGSSREHAPWGLQEYGFDAIVAPTFADIFRSNCTKIGLLTCGVSSQVWEQLVHEASKPDQKTITIDLASLQIVSESGTHEFTIGADARSRLLEGSDEIDGTLRFEKTINHFECRRAAWMPNLRNEAAVKRAL